MTHTLTDNTREKDRNTGNQTGTQINRWERVNERENNSRRDWLWSGERWRKWVMERSGKDGEATNCNIFWGRFSVACNVFSSMGLSSCQFLSNILAVTRIIPAELLYHYPCPTAQFFFLVADTQLYKRLCPSVRPSVRPSVGWSARRWARV